MHGNVSEWVEDCYHENYEGAPTDGSAWKTGCYSSSAVVRDDDCSPGDRRAAHRFWFPPSTRGHYSVGFRLVQDLNP